MPTTNDLLKKALQKIFFQFQQLINESFSYNSGNAANKL